MAADDLIEAYQAHLRERSCSPRTVKDYGYHLKRCDAAMPYGLDCATEIELRAWVWRGDLKPSSRAVAYAAISGFFTWAVKVGYLDFAPSSGLIRPRVRDGVPRVASDEQARMVLTGAKEPYRLWATVAAYAGARCIEIHRLQREDITETVTILRGKGDKDRQVPTHPALWAVVRDLPPGPITDMPDEQAISNRFSRYCRVHWGVKLSLHRFRGWFATTAYNATKDPRAIQVLLGHSNLATTTRYIAAAIPQQRAAVAGLPVFDTTVQHDSGETTARYIEAGATSDDEDDEA